MLDVRIRHLHSVRDSSEELHLRAGSRHVFKNAGIEARCSTGSGFSVQLWFSGTAIAFQPFVQYRSPCNCKEQVKPSSSCGSMDRETQKTTEIFRRQSHEVSIGACIPSRIPGLLWCCGARA